MPNSYVQYNGTGAQTNFVVPFPYLAQIDVGVQVGGVTTTAWTWVNSTTIQITTPPPVGTLNVDIRRRTPIVSPIVTYVDGGAEYAANLNVTALQSLYALQEREDVFPNTTNINNVAADLTNINAVAADLANINAVAAVATGVNNVAADLTNINAVAADLANIDILAAGLPTKLSLTGGTLSGALVQAVGTGVASASTINLTAVAGNACHVTGAVGINSVTLAAGKLCEVIFDGILVLTHHATNNNLPGAAPITTAAGDRATYWSDATTVYCLHYQRANGTAVVATDASLTTTDVTTNDASTAKHGFLKKLSNVSTEFMNGTGTWSAPAGAGATLGTQQASTSGTAIDFTGIPAGTKEIKIMFVGVSTNGSSNYLIQIGDAGGIETSSYLSEAARESGVVANSTAGFIMSASLGASQTMSGTITLTLENSSAFTWTAVGMFGTASGSVQFGTGSKSLSQELSQLRITMVNGTDTFNAGAINIQYRS